MSWMLQKARKPAKSTKIDAGRSGTSWASSNNSSVTWQSNAAACRKSRANNKPVHHHINKDGTKRSCGYTAERGFASACMLHRFGPDLPGQTLKNSALF